MTRTEERLTDALAAVARGVPEETLPALPARGPVRHRWGRWLAPLAAAAAVALIVVLVSAVHLFSQRAPAAARASWPPRYYATVQMTGIFIRDTATGAVTAKIPNRPHGQGGSVWFAMDVAAADNGREFIAAYTTTSPRTYQQRTRLYSFHLTSAGHITGFSPVPGGPINGLLAARAIAVSPDGSKAALVLYRLNPTGPQRPAEIVVVDLRTGARGLWRGGLEHAGMALNIPSISWQPGGRGLVFLALWCTGEPVHGGYCTPGAHYAQVRTLSLGAGGGLLSQGSALLSQSPRYPDTVQALLGPGARSVIVAELRGPQGGKHGSVPRYLQVIQVPLGGGAPRVLYRAPMGGNAEVFLGSDASGRYLLLAWTSNGWLDNGVLRPLEPRYGTTIAEPPDKIMSSDAW
jgi:hypothetical protein